MLVSVVCWGASFTWIKMALGTLPPAGLAAARFGIAALVLLCVTLAIPRLRDQLLSRALWGRFFAIGFVGTFLPNILQNYGMLHLSASLSGVVQGAGPIYTAIIAAVLLDERFGARRLVGSIAAFSGTMVLSFGSKGSGNASAYGLALIVGSSVAYAFYTVALRASILDRVHPMSLLAGTSIGGTIPLLAFAAATEPLGWVAKLSGSEVGLLLILALVPTVLAYSCYVGALSRMEASRAAGFIFLVPVVALILGRAFLGDSLSAVQLACSAAIIAGLVVAESERRRDTGVEIAYRGRES